MGNHTKTPWKLEPADRGFVISALSGQYDVCVVRDIGNQDNEANAELIVRAVNNYEKLRELLQICAEQLDDDRSSRRYMDSVVSESAWELLLELNNLEAENGKQAY